MKTAEQKIEELEKQLQELKNEVANQNQPKFKKGDFCWWSGNNPQFVIILGVCPTYPNDSYSAFLLYEMTSKNKSLNSEFLRLATEAERKQSIDKLREKGKTGTMKNAKLLIIGGGRKKEIFITLFMKIKLYLQKRIISLLMIIITIKVLFQN